MTLEERFWSKVNILGEDDCWEWNAGGRGNGYGCFKYDGKTIDSHRMVWFLTHGEFPNLLVLHSCDNRKCCNPKHLFLGTHQDNVDDMIFKGRKILNPAFGENAGGCKLTEKEVLKIRNLYKTKKYTQLELSKIFNIDRSQIGRIIRNNSWKHI